MLNCLIILPFLSQVHTGIIDLNFIMAHVCPHISVLPGNISAEMLLVPIRRASTHLQGSQFQINSEQEEVRGPNYQICKKINNYFCNGVVV
jgi:hypothetical protein